MPARPPRTNRKNFKGVRITFSQNYTDNVFQFAVPINPENFQSERSLRCNRPPPPESALGRRRFFSYPDVVIRFLRLVGLMNAAVWLGAAIFFTSGAAPALFSEEVKAVLGPNYLYLRGAVAQVVVKSYFHLQLVCSVIALLHLLAEWLYMGRPARKFSLVLLMCLFALTLAGGYWLQPKLGKLNEVRYRSTQPAEREAAMKSFSTWHAAAQAGNVLMIFGLAVYVWRVANPPDSLRFLNPMHIRS